MKLTRKTIQVFARTFAKDEDGATAIEYGLFAALIGAVIVGTVATLGGQTNTGFSEVSDELTDAGYRTAFELSFTRPVDQGGVLLAGTPPRSPS